MPVKHTFTNPKADGGDATIVRPSDWNADHVIDATGIVIGGDTNLYRSAANVLKTDDQLQSTGIITANTGGGATSVQIGTKDAGGSAAGGITLGADANLYRDSPDVVATDGLFRTKGVSSTDQALATKVSSDSQDRLYVDSSGTHQWGSGSANPDVRLRRSVAGRVVLDTNSSAVATEFGMESTAGRRAKMDMRVTGDTYERTAVWGDATLAGLTFGPGGASAADTSFYRGGIGTLQTNGTIYQQGVQSATWNGASHNDVGLGSGVTQLRLENVPVATGVSAALATPVINSTTDGTSFSTAAFSAVVGTEYIIILGITKGTAPDNPTGLTKSGLTIGPQYAVSNNLTRIYVMAAVGTATTSSAFTATFAAAQTGCFITVLALTGNHALATTSSTLNSIWNGQVAPIANSGGTLGYDWRKGRFLIGCAMQEAAVAPATDGGYTSYASATIATPNEGYSVKSSNAGDGLMSWSTVLTGTGVATILGVPPPSQGAATITGIAGGAQGRQLTLTNSSLNQFSDPGVYTAEDDAIVLKHDNGASSSSNRILTPGGQDYVIPGGASVPLFYDGVVSRWRVVAGTRGPVRRVYTASGTWTKPPGLSYIDVEVVGGGGGGGGIGATPAGQQGAGGCGGGGGYAKKLLSSSDLTAASYTVTVGTGGSAGAASGTGDGGTGTSSVFVKASTDAWSSPTGAAGTGATAGGTGSATSLSAAGGNGGAGSGGDVNVMGGDGDTGRIVGGNISIAAQGGSTIYGGGQRQAMTGVGGTGAVYGTGGTGGTNIQSSAARAGGAGAVGVVIITEYFA